MDDPLHIGQPHVASGMTVSQALVVEPEQVKDRRVQIMHVHGILDGLVAKLVGLAVVEPCPGAPTGQPEGEPLSPSGWSRSERQLPFEKMSEVLGIKSWPAGPLWSGPPLANGRMTLTQNESYLVGFNDCR